MSIASEITRLQNAKDDIKTSIEGKGVTVPSTTTLDGYSTLIDSISGGGGADLSDYFNLAPSGDMQSNKLIKAIPTNLIDTSNVTSMAYMFYYCRALTTLDLSGFNTSRVTNMAYMFSYSQALTSLDLSGLDTSNVTNMGYMFQECRALTTLDLSGFDTSLVTRMSNMFQNCINLSNITFGANWKSYGTQTYTNQNTGTWTNTTTGVSYTGLQNLLVAGRTKGAIEGTWVKS